MSAHTTSETQNVAGLRTPANLVQGTTGLAARCSNTFQRARVVADKSLKGLLIATIIGLVGVTFRMGIESGQVGRFYNSDYGTILYAICANLSQEKYRAGRYVCANSAERQMRDAGLWYTDDALARAGKTLPQWEADGAFLNQALTKVFASSPLASDGGVYDYGWGGDSGYMDFVQGAFLLFGTRLEALYYGYFFLLSVSTILFCIQFWRNYFAAFTVLAFQFSFIAYLDLGYLQPTELGSLGNPRILSLLAIIPMFHALFLIVYRIRFGLRAGLLFVPQALLIAAAADFRALSYAAFITLLICNVALLVIDRRRQTLREAGRRYWPTYAIAVCLAVGAGLQAATADPRIAQMGGMRYHTFWEPLFWDLETDQADWQAKYRGQFDGATGDDIARVAVQSYRARHGLLNVKNDFVGGNESLGMTRVAYEKYTRDAYIEFARANPWFIVRLKYFNALNIMAWVKPLLLNEWRALHWWLYVLAAFVGFALIAEVRRNVETLRRLSICAGLVTLSGFLIAIPIWATAIEGSIMTDLCLLNATASFALALWVLVSAGVLVSKLRLPSHSSLRVQVDRAPQRTS